MTKTPAASNIAAQIGGKMSGPRRTRVEASPQFADGKFRNNVPTATGIPLSAVPRVAAAVFTGGAARRPHQPVPLVSAAATDARGLHVTWYGHSTALIEIEGQRVLLDPVWSERCSPSQLAGPKRLHQPPVALADLPPVDAVVISHDHYDHLDMASIQTLAGRPDATIFVVPLGVGAHLERWGVPADRIAELDWNESTTVGGLDLVATPARHFSGRGFSRDETLWASWVIKGPSRSVFYSGDTGYFPGFAEIGERHGPFDVTLVQVGAYGDDWADIHMVPEDGVRTHRDVDGGLMIPVHWATFDLAAHDWSEPAERTWREAKARDIRLAIPRPGQRVDVDSPPEIDAWWQQVA
ncbi:L-ascorbate metabolism protein UlaG (beta-lactamase superfamily) [Actinoplanes lutulentus]|uniref:L-ascorbate metabolism protein UlaG (Beta-lactamase superfamily) n=1 Tax=Actinoplanes lutulentus TaxID=1287878 RepID=A0A327Z3H3_9ACTN|nr:MBL fold metallo-hydrolase [Actinoplanes lutulentus]MBB2948861.1 L-ascorbate metabolism protein UlaG (beta-lactamase superfamily) [Actinoplanes lutulentus]RAK29771.1 L-ascorbate metabolism protein UlaG (beta-lactamase superfamily) [Actinoplanes lutulentus]